MAKAAVDDPGGPGGEIAEEEAGGGPAPGPQRGWTHWRECL